MSRKTVEFRRKVSQQTTRNIEALIPRANVYGGGTYLQYVNTAHKKAPHGTRGFGHACTAPLDAEKATRLTGLVK